MRPQESQPIKRIPALFCLLFVAFRGSGLSHVRPLSCGRILRALLIRSNYDPSLETKTLAGFANICAARSLNTYGKVHVNSSIEDFPGPGGHFWNKMEDIHKKKNKKLPCWKFQVSEWGEHHGGVLFTCSIPLCPTPPSC